MVPTTQKLVLITGATGDVGTALRPSLRYDYRLRLQYRRRPPTALALSEESVQANIEDFAAMMRVVDGVDAIIHLAAERSPQATWEEVRGPNIDGVYNVLEAARRAGVPKVIFASTNHVMGMYDREHNWPIHPEQPVRPDGYYGTSKAFGEALARYYVDEFALSVICLRIGWVLERPHNEMALRMWLSPRDLGQLVRLSLETSQRFGLYYGVSNNQRRKWSIENARSELGYNPVDDAELFAASCE
ncbi:MAG: NAD(P)-dependent oxidoreductase [Ktedonobacteraceae bacterium]|nr:NAD(P)-dependent oxidoreductase [Ktedonobacteraceae bacterium]